MNKIIYSLVFLVLITSLESQQKSDPKEALSAKKDKSKEIQAKSRRVQECVCCGAPRDCVLDFDK